jgi:hypothetical protein
VSRCTCCFSYLKTQEVQLELLLIPHRPLPKVCSLSRSGEEMHGVEEAKEGMCMPPPPPRPPATIAALLGGRAVSEPVTARCPPLPLLAVARSRSAQR